MKIKPPSQNDLVLQLLNRHRGQWVSLPVIAAHMKGFAVHSRVANLRKLGCRIENRVETVGRAKFSFYRLA